ncbi:Predicted arabinose efflux permease, MFS family [Streptomyces zhaozhouensis]|uniref:Predicted arabinose efflux permease, MFS family n=1 Tax=Streptomyces zhaozhouensis TaxID=1300267 RepID=A0A286DUB2_9ACTN|nr:MFS transporter [Streptomyces zhaozhouensis]SOD62256.1 Predicted arabinose efflux permease, MFS family [Streptomyces zhaozhouensis]
MDQRLRLLACAYAVSSYGNYLNLIALSLFSYEVTGTAFGVGLLMALRLCAGFAAGLAAGALTARIGRRTTMIGADLAQATAMAALAIGGEATPLAAVACAVVVLGAGNTCFNVALRSAVPVMVGQEARGRVNGMLVTARSLATVLGFASAAAVIGWGGYPLAFALNAASFAVSAVALVLLRPRTDLPPGAEEQQPPEGRAGETGPVRRRRALAGLPALLLGLVLLRGLDALASSSHNVALPVVANTDHADAPAVFMTQFWAAWAVGTVLAHLVLRRRAGEGAWSTRAFALGTCAMSVAFLTAFLGLPALGLVLAAACAGFADGWTEIVYTSRLQAVPDRERGRLFGLSATAEQSGFALGTVVAAAALEVWPAVTVVGLFHGAAFCGALVLLLLTTRRRAAAPREPATTRV